MRDLRSNVAVAQSISPRAASATVTGSGVDLQGYDSAMVVLSIGTYTDGTHTFKLQDSADNVTYADAAAADLLGSFTAASTTAASNTVQEVGYVGTGRYVRVIDTVAGGTTGALVSANIVRGNPARGAA